MVLYNIVRLVFINTSSYYYLYFHEYFKYNLTEKSFGEKYTHFQKRFQGSTLVVYTMNPLVPFAEHFRSTGLKLPSAVEVPRETRIIGELQF